VAVAVVVAVPAAIAAFAVRSFVGSTWFIARQASVPGNSGVCHERCENGVPCEREA